MGSTYLASEYHAGEDHPFATAAPHKDVAVVPDDILLVECVDIPWTQVPGAKEGQRFSGTYEPLFKFMEVIEEKFRETEEDYYKRIKANDVQRG